MALTPPSFSSLRKAEGPPEENGGQSLKAPKRDSGLAATSGDFFQVLHQSAAVDHQPCVVSDPDLKDAKAGTATAHDGKGDVVGVVVEDEDVSLVDSSPDSAFGNESDGVCPLFGFGDDEADKFGLLGWNLRSDVEDSQRCFHTNSMLGAR